MNDNLAKYSGMHGWILRVSYIAALLAFAIVCFRFYDQARAQNTEIALIRSISNAVADYDLRAEEFAQKAFRVSERFQGAPAAGNADASLTGLTLKQRKEAKLRRPTDPDIISSRTGLEHQRKLSEQAFVNLEQVWKQARPEIAVFLTRDARFMALDDPFKHHVALSNGTKLANARTKRDIYWISRAITENYNSFVQPSNEHIQIRLRKLIDSHADRQGHLLQQFLLFSLGLIAILGFAVFLPVDIFLQKLLGSLKLQHDRADKAMHLAQTADRAKSEFLANMSHEIRTPMNGVMGMAELLARTELDSKQRTFTDIIVKSGAALLTIINDILDFSKIDAGQMELDPAPFRLAEAIEDVATLVSSKVAEKDLELAVRIDPALPAMLTGDVGRLRQIVTNLMSNAVKFTDAGHVLVDVSGGVVSKGEAMGPHKGEDQQVKLHFRIEDTGIGIPPDKCRTVFDKFSQVDASATRRHEGTGLGLAIASSLVNLMGGEIGVESEIGKGSTFWFSITLPAYGEADDEGAPAIPVDVTGSRILVVDDNAVNRAILLEQMEAWGFDAATASSGAEAIEILNVAVSHGMVVDCVILDYHMPEMNGEEAARHIRSDFKLGQTPIVMLTSVDQTAEGKAFSSLGINGHLTKPARSAHLLDVLTQALQDSAYRKDGESADGKAIAAARMIGKMEIADPDHLDIDEENHVPDSEDGQKPTVPDGPELAEIEEISNAESLFVNVLVADDNEVNRIVLSQILNTTDLTFITAVDGEEAIGLYHKVNPDIILLDVSMPKINGLEATRAIRESEKRSGNHTPIIGVTAHALKGDMELCLEAGMDDYLSKPVSPDMLISKIAKWLDKKLSRKSI